MISLTQPTEYGTVYSREELAVISQWCKKNKLFLHIDGAVFGNAAHLLNSNFKEISASCGADVISFGGTKNGFLFGEAIVV